MTRVFAPSSPLLLPGRGSPPRLRHLPPLMHRGLRQALSARSHRVRPVPQRSRAPPTPPGAVLSKSSVSLSSQQHAFFPSGGTAPRSAPSSLLRRLPRSHSAQPQAEARQRPNSAGASLTGGTPVPPGVCDGSAAPNLSVRSSRGCGPDRLHPRVRISISPRRLEPGRHFSQN
ncbi:hypothetical protein NDU88_005549 [Pleurodeles waltl]|uniref:Uncharacterized protein n=1 Tax=Pleurodeles waltl TaxID=8319 RepID=A0AAV7VN48_PLEWA|nr:hypothetical protein NDU88_005549 [Pleurodeles waltl]